MSAAPTKHSSMEKSASWSGRILCGQFGSHVRWGDVLWCQILQSTRRARPGPRRTGMRIAHWFVLEYFRSLSWQSSLLTWERIRHVEVWLKFGYHFNTGVVERLHICIFFVYSFRFVHRNGALLGTLSFVSLSTLGRLCVKSVSMFAKSLRMTNKKQISKSESSSSFCCVGQRLAM